MNAEQEQDAPATAEEARAAWMKVARDFDTAFALIINAADDTVLWRDIAAALEEARNEGRTEAAPERASALPAEVRGDGPCMDCGTVDTPVWFTDNLVWNQVLGGRLAYEDPGGFLCPTCFIRRSFEAGLRPANWRLIPEFPRQWNP